MDETFDIRSKSPAKLISLMRVLLAARYDLMDIHYEGPAQAPTAFVATFEVDNSEMNDEDVANVIAQLRHAGQQIDALAK